MKNTLEFPAIECSAEGRLGESSCLLLFITAPKHYLLVSVNWNIMTHLTQIHGFESR